MAETLVHHWRTGNGRKERGSDWRSEEERQKELMKKEGSVKGDERREGGGKRERWRCKVEAKDGRSDGGGRRESRRE